jgi:hypothetical protein
VTTRHVVRTLNVTLGSQNCLVIWFMWRIAGERILTEPLWVLFLTVISVVAILVSVASPSFALSIRGRHLVGIIQNVNALARDAELLQPGKENPLRFTWDKQTRFVANQHFVDAAILSSGARVEVICIRPFFGSPYVTRVTLLSNSTPHDSKIK